MHINRIYIENFGVLSKYSYDAATGFNQIIGENGAGKTTLAVFIRCMFYGMKNSYRRKNIDDAIRKKYEPWQGGEYGGYIDFQTSDGEYRIARSFSQKGDTYELTDLKTGLASDRYGEKPGEEIFGVDEEAYAATAWIGTRQLELSMNDSIHARLGEYLGLDEDCGEYGIAYRRLDEKRRSYVKTGRRGSIAHLEDRLADVYNRQSLIKEKRKELEIRKTKLMAEKAELEKQLNEASGVGSTHAGDVNASTTGVSLTNVSLNSSDEAKSSSEEATLQNMKNKKSGKRVYRLLFLTVLIISGCIAATGLFRQYYIMAVAGAGCFISAIFVVFFELYAHRKNEKRVEQQTYDIQLIRYEEEMNTKLELICKEYEEYEKEYSLLSGQVVLLEEDIKRERHEYEVILMTMEYLEKARAEYASNYMSRLIELTNRYLKRFDDNLAMQIQLDSNYVPMLNVGVHKKQLGYLSAGMRDVVWLCQRLALIDMLYTKEKICVVIDDAFVNLDDNMLKKTAGIIEEASEKFQIIYLTCRRANSLDI